MATIRAPLAPIGWPSAIAPPLTLTLSQSKPSSRPSASVCAANASLISIRSNASIGSSIRSSRRRTPSTGARKSHFGRDLGLGVADDPGERLQAQPLDGPLARDDRRGGAVGDARRVAGRDRALGRVAAVLAVGEGEDRLEPGERLGGRVAPRPLVDRDDGLATLGVADGHRRHLGVEPAGVDGRDRLLVAGQRERVLVLAADVVLDRDALGVGAHVAVLDRAPQAVVDGRVDELRVAEAVAEPGAGEQVRRAVHRLHAAGDRDLGVAGADLRRGQHDRLEPRAADPVDGRRGGRVREAGLEHGLASRRLARHRPGGPGPSAPRRYGGRRVEAGALDGGPDGDAPELRGRDARPARRRTCRSACAPR